MSHPKADVSPLQESTINIDESLSSGNSDEKSTPGSYEAEQTEEFATNYVKGIRLHVISTALCLTLFLTNLEVPIVSTSLVTITNDLSGFGESSWVITAYLLTYIGFLVIWAKLSDIFGRKSLLCVSILLFVAFSGACGGAQSIETLIVFRALQGIGGSGIYSLGLVIFFELVPKTAYALYTAIVSGTFTISLLLGPIIGGAIDNSSAWRWVFWLNVPIASVTGITLAMAIPRNFPYHGELNNTQRAAFELKLKSSLKRVDFLGTLLLLGATVLLITGIEQAGREYAWRSAFVISLLTLSGVMWALVLLWSRFITLRAGDIEPIFPWRFVQSRIWVGMLLCGFFLGGPFTVGIYQIPQRYQVVNGLSPLSAGVRLLPFTFVCPAASVLVAGIVGKTKVPPLYFVISAAILQIIGFGLLTTLPNSTDIKPAQYIYEIIAGAGTGINISTLILMTPFSVPRQDQSVAIGSLNQFRYMGGAIALAIVANILNSYILSALRGILQPQEIAMILESSVVADSFSPELQQQIREVFAKGYNLQMKILVGLAAGQLPASLLMWQKKQIIV